MLVAAAEEIGAAANSGMAGGVDVNNGDDDDDTSSSSSDDEERPEQTEMSVTTSLGRSPGSSPRTPGRKDLERKRSVASLKAEACSRRLSQRSDRDGRLSGVGADAVAQLAASPVDDGAATTSPALRCRASFAYDPQRDDELAMQPGDIISVHQKNEDGWWEGSIGERRGVFPANYCETIDE